MSRLFNQTTGWIVKLPWLTLLLIFAISGIALIGYYNPDWIKDLFKKDQADAAGSPVAQKVDDTPRPPVAGFSFRADSVIVVESPQLFSPIGAKAMRAIVDDLEADPLVTNVTWMDKIPMLNIFSLPQPVLPHESASQTRFDLAKEKALRHPFIHGQLLSADCQTTLLLVNIDRFFLIEDDDVITKIREIAEASSQRFPDFEVEFSVTGRLPMWVTAKESQASNNFYYQVIGYGMITFMSIILFRGFASVIVVSMAPCLGVFWTLGFVRFFEFTNNPFNDVVLPVMVSLIALTDGVHLMVEIRKLRSSGLSPRDAAAEGIRKVGLACALTSLTTAIGFGSLALANHELVQQFGYSCVVGVILSFIAVVTSIPLVCSTWIGKFVHIGQEKSLVDKNLSKISGVIDFVMKRKNIVSTLAILSTVVCILCSLQLRPDERQSSIVPDSSEAAVGLRKIDKAMNGVEHSSVSVGWSKEISDESPEIVKVIEKVDTLLGNEELIGHPLSILKLIESMPGDGKVEDRISMLELLPPSLKRAFYTPEQRTALVSFRVRDLGIATYDPVFKRIEKGIEEIQIQHPEFKMSLTGGAIWRWENLFQIVIDLATSLGTAVLIIFAVLAVVYRSLRIGLISLIPNLFPLAVSGLYLAVTGQALEIVTVCAFTVCLGIAVDDTIHFLTRYQEELEECADESVAIRKAFTGVGTALILTTIVLVTGFSTVLFSDSRDHYIFASMGMITLSAALFADLVFLPALLARFGSRASD